METPTPQTIAAPRPAASEAPVPPEDLLAWFDALPAGETFRLEMRHDPAPVLAELRARRPGRFEWSPDLDGPDLWRIDVVRRAAGDGEARGVSEALAWDHDRLDAIERAAFAARDRGDSAEAIRLFDAFSRGLDRHIAFEETLLFPAFEEATGHPAGAGPTEVMREEHRIIRRLLAEIAAELRDAAASPVDRRRSLTWVLGEHNAKEEEILYPMTDAALGPEGADRLVAEIQAFRAG